MIAYLIALTNVRLHALGIAQICVKALAQQCVHRIVRLFAPMHVSLYA